MNCPDGEECVNTSVCSKTKACWFHTVWLPEQKRKAKEPKPNEDGTKKSHHKEQY